MADLESTLNQQLGSVLQQIMADEALRGYLKGSRAERGHIDEETLVTDPP